MATDTSGSPMMAAFSEDPHMGNDAPLFAMAPDDHDSAPPVFGAHFVPSYGAPQGLIAPTVTGGQLSGSGSSQSQHHLLASSSPSAPQAGTFTVGGGSGSVPQHVVSLSGPDAQNRNVYVASLPGNFTDDNLRDLFAPYGTIISSKMFNNDGRPGSHGRAYGFVMYAEEASVQRAIDALVGAVVGSQRIQVRRAKPSSRGPSQTNSANASPANSNTQAHLMPGFGQPPPSYMLPVAQPVAQPVAWQQVGVNQLGQPVYMVNGQPVVMAPGPQQPFVMMAAPQGAPPGQSGQILMQPQSQQPLFVVNGQQFQQPQPGQAQQQGQFFF